MGMVPFSLLVIVVLLFMAMTWGRMYGAARPRFVAVVSHTCAHCVRAQGEMDAFGTRHMFHVIDAETLGEGEELRQMIDMGYTGSVPFFANVENGRKVIGYMPHKEILSVLGV
jgi:hypothetical protein